MSMETIKQLVTRAFTEVLPSLGYQTRREQQQYATHVADRLMSSPSVPKHADVLMIEGATGTGKTLGYLIPCAIYAAVTGEKVGIGTHTLALQDQLFGRKAIYSGRSPSYETGDRSDLAIALEVVRRLKLLDRPLTAGYRKGRHAYLSPFLALRNIERIKNSPLWADQDHDQRDRIEALAGWAVDVRNLATLVNGQPKDDLSPETIEQLQEDPYQGLIDAWAETNPLPDLLPADEIQLIDSDAYTKENPFYRFHADSAKDADVVVFSHAMMLFNLNSGRSLLPEFGVVVHDEADTLGDVAENFMRHKFRPVTIMHAMTEARPALKELLKTNTALRAVWDGLYKQTVEFTERLAALRLEKFGEAEAVGRRHQEWLFSRSDEVSNEIHRRTDQLVRSMRAVHRALSEHSIVVDDRVSRFVAIADDATKTAENILALLKNYLEQGDQLSLLNEEGKQRNGQAVEYRVSGISWSPRLHLASVEVIDLFPGRVFSREWRWESNTRLVVLTSATLRTPAGAHSDEWTFMRSMVGAPYSEVGVAVLPSDRFGRIGHIYQLCDAPAPFLAKTADDEDEIFLAVGDPNVDAEARYDPQWLEMAASGLLQVAQHSSDRQAALVLAGSFRDVLVLQDYLADDARFWLHTSPSQRVAEGIEALRSGAAQVLVTPSLWAGTNIRARDGRQLIRHLVMLRLPYLPPDAMLLAALRRYYERLGVPEPDKRAASKHYPIMVNKALHKFTQGLGRGIRDKDDRIDFWILDPRFPLHANVRILLGGGLGRPVGSGELRWHAALPDRFRDLPGKPGVVRILRVSDSDTEIVDPRKAADAVPVF